MGKDKVSLMIKTASIIVVGLLFFGVSEILHFHTMCVVKDDIKQEIKDEVEQEVKTLKQYLNQIRPKRDS